MGQRPGPAGFRGAGARRHRPLQHNRHDELFTLAGAHAAHDRITAHYAQTSTPDAYTGRFYDGHHKFGQAMQRDAFAWLTAQLH